MGNIKSRTDGEQQCRLRTWVISRYLTSLTRDQLLDLRNACLEYNNNNNNTASTTTPTTTLPEKESSLYLMQQQRQRQRQWRRRTNSPSNQDGVTTGNKDTSSSSSSSSPSPLPYLSRKVLATSLERAHFVAGSNEMEVIQDLYTLWDETDSERVPMMAFLVSLCPLACHTRDNLLKFFRYTLAFYDVLNTNVVGRHDLIWILQTLNATLSYLGDASLEDHEIHDVVDELIETMTRLLPQEEQRRQCHTHHDAQSGDGHELKMRHDDVATMLAVDPVIRDLLTRPPPPPPDDHDTLSSSRPPPPPPNDHDTLSSSFQETLTHHNDDDDDDDEVVSSYIDRVFGGSILILGPASPTTNPKRLSRNKEASWNMMQQQNQKLHHLSLPSNKPTPLSPRQHNCSGHYADLVKKRYDQGRTTTCKENKPTITIRNPRTSTVTPQPRPSPTCRSPRTQRGGASSYMGLSIRIPQKNNRNSIYHSQSQQSGEDGYYYDEEDDESATSNLTEEIMGSSLGSTPSSKTSISNDFQQNNDHPQDDHHKDKDKDQSGVRFFFADLVTTTSFRDPPGRHDDDDDASEDGMETLLVASSSPRNYKNDNTVIPLFCDNIMQNKQPRGGGGGIFQSPLSSTRRKARAAVSTLFLTATITPRGCRVPVNLLGRMFPKQKMEEETDEDDDNNSNSNTNNNNNNHNQPQVLIIPKAVCTTGVAAVVGSSGNNILMSSEAELQTEQSPQKTTFERIRQHSLLSGLPRIGSRTKSATAGDDNDSGCRDTPRSPKERWNYFNRNNSNTRPRTPLCRKTYLDDEEEDGSHFTALVESHLAEIRSRRVSRRVNV